MKRLTFEYAPEFVVLCVIVALAYAAIQYYRTKHPWNNKVNWILFALRSCLAFLLAFLLLGPIVNQINNIIEKPYFVILQDNSASVKETTDSTTLNRVQHALLDLQEMLEDKGYELSLQSLTGNDFDAKYTASASDIHGALKNIANQYEGRSVSGVILVSDGIYNAGISPLHADYNFPVYTIGVGDTTERSDISIKNVAYNKIAYQGNKFPVRAEVQVTNLDAESITVSILKRGKLIEKQTKKTAKDQLLTFDFNILAEEQGIQKIDIQVEPKREEFNTRNNTSSVFVEVVEGKKKILIVASSPHPDIKALREVIGKNSNYEFLLHIPGVSELQPSDSKPENVDLAIFHQAPDIKGRTLSLFQNFAKSKTSLFLVLGPQSDLQQLARLDMPVKFEGPVREYDEVTPVTNPSFSNFIISQETNTIVTSYPPVSVHFGKLRLPLTSTPLLYQRIGSVSTEKPLLAVDVKDSRKIGFMLGDGLWRWRLNEFDRTENTVAFDEVFGKLIQFLSTTEDKRKFRSYPIQQEFSDTEPVIFESQVYNDIFEPVYGNTIEIDVTGEQGKQSTYTYVTSAGNTRYQIGGLKEGVYKFKSRTSINGKREEVKGEFAVVERQAELQNLAADFPLLRKLSTSTGGAFYKASAFDKLKQDLQKTEAQSVIHSEETYDSMINLKWVFFVLVLIVSVEWFLRKYLGAY